MSDAVSGVAEVNSAAGSGTGSARKRENARKARRREGQDTVFISDEAKRLLDSETLADEPLAGC